MRVQNLPKYPDHIYRQDGWTGWHDFLGSSVLRGKWIDFDILKQRIKGKFKNREEYKAWATLHREQGYPVYVDDIAVYRSKWRGWHDFLGTRNVQPGKWRDMESALIFAQSLHLRSYAQWQDACRQGKIPDDIPKHPHAVYKNKGWIDWASFLGTQNIKNGFLDFVEARKKARKLNISSYVEYRSLAMSNDLPTGLPKSLHGVYGHDPHWKGAEDFLGICREEKVIHDRRKRLATIMQRAKKNQHLPRAHNGTKMESLDYRYISHLRRTKRKNNSNWDNRLDSIVREYGFQGCLY